MGLTITNTNTLTLLNILNKTQTRQSNILTQLSTGLKINKGADDPAGLIALRSLEAELTGVNGAIDNAQRADSMLGVADGSITEISSLLDDIESLVMASASEAGLTASEKAANQSQIDSALQSIDRIVRTTNFNGKRLIDGTQAIVTTGVDASDLNSVRVYSRGSQTSDTTMNVSVTAAAAKGTGTLTMGGVATSGTAELEITGTLGTMTVAIASGADASAVATAINGATAQTGVSAAANAGDVDLTTTGYGSDDYLSVDVISGGSLAGGGSFSAVAKTFGTDASVSINGQTANVEGLDVFYNANGISLSFSMEESFGTAVGTTSFAVSASLGGATFQLGTDATSQVTIGIDSLATHKLGGGDSGGFLTALKSGGAADLNTDVATALKIVRKASSDVANAQGRIGAFQKFQVQTTINSLNAAKTGLTSAKSVVGDTDFAQATAELNRESVLLNSGISLLGLANQQSAQILTLLG